ncbi:MAG: UbiA prenyltransferase family protein [Bacteroidales bacterium]|nr:UbiA prenyltransferase family protein [Bacteroidales bacterium]
MISKLILIIKLLRPHQWVKNLFIFLPLFFDQSITDTKRLWACFIAFAGFSLITSSIYCLNDCIDSESDKLHPRKRQRPIASGAVSKSTAGILIFFLILAGFSIFVWGHMRFALTGVALFYLVMNIGYSVWLKRYAIVDVFIIATGFVLRIVIGGIAGSVMLSHWIILMTFLLALFLGLAKRKDDVLIYDSTGIKMRKNIAGYNALFIDSLLSITATITIISYIMYAVSPEVVKRFNSDYVYLTSFFVIAGMFRYLQLTMVRKNSGSPTKIFLKDRFIQLCVAAWVASFAFIIYIR